MNLRRVLFLVPLAALFAAAAHGCGYGRPACAVVDAAADACIVLRYMAPDGTKREVRVPQSELASFAEAVALRQSAEGVLGAAGIDPGGLPATANDAGADAAPWTER